MFLDADAFESIEGDLGQQFIESRRYGDFSSIDALQSVLSCYLVQKVKNSQVLVVEV